MKLQQLKDEGKKEYREAVRYGNEEDFIDSLIDKAYEAGVKFGEECQRMSNVINNSKIH